MCKNSSWLVHLAVPAGCKKLAKETGCCAAATRCTPTESTLPVRPIEGGENQAIFPSVFEGLRGLRGKPGIFAIDQSLAQEFRLEYVYICGSMYVDRNPSPPLSPPTWSTRIRPVPSGLRCLIKPCVVYRHLHYKGINCYLCEFLR